MARFAISSDDDHSAVLWILTLLALTYTTLTMLLRLWVKLRMLGLDDALAVIAQLLAYGSMGIVLYALGKGRQDGVHAPRDAVSTALAQVLRTTQILHLLALATAKMTMGVFLRRIFDRADQRRVLALCNAFVGMSGAWGLGAALAISVGCDTTTEWSCTGQATRWLVIALVDCIGEVLLVALAIYLVSDLRIRLSEKTAVCTAFAWRVGLVALSLIHYRFCSSAVRSRSLSTALSRVVVCEQVTICYSLMSITWPFSRQWIRSFGTSALALMSAHGRARPVERQKSDETGASWQEKGTHSASVD